MIQCLVGSTARMIREGTGDIAFARAGGSPIKTVLQNRCDVPVGTDTNGDSACARCLETLGAILLVQAHDAEARAITLFGARAIAHDECNERCRFGAHLVCPSHQSSG